MMDNRFILFFTPSSVIENRNRFKVQQAINALNETEKMIQGKISARDEAIRIIREDIKRKRDNNNNNNNGSSINNNKQYLFMQMNKMKQHINSKNIYYSTLLKIFSMKLKIDDAKAYNQINEGLKLCVHGMKHLISDDKLREMEDTLDQIDEQNQSIKYIESSMNQLNDMLHIDETNKMNEMNYKDGDDDSIWMDELNKLMSTDDNNDDTYETTDVVKKVMRIDDSKKNNITNYSYVSPLNTKILSTGTSTNDKSNNNSSSSSSNNIINKKEDKIALLKMT